MFFSNSRAAPRRGFTLVELLVVIGIIALLMGILLPALGKARESANQIKCQANIRSIVQAMMIHAHDHHGYMPLAGSIAPGNRPQDVQDEQRLKYDYFDDNGILQLFSTPGALAQSLGVEIRTDSRVNAETDEQAMSFRKFFLCPSDREGGRFGATVGGGTNCYNSYAFNEAALGWADDGQLGVNGHSRLRGLSVRFPHPSSLMLVTDGAPRGGDGAGRWQVYYDHDSDCTLRDIYLQNDGNNPNHQAGMHDCGSWDLLDVTRHRGRMNVGFADGHGENILINEGPLGQISLDVDFPS